MDRRYNHSAYCMEFRSRVPAANRMKDLVLIKRQNGVEWALIGRTLAAAYLERIYNANTVRARLRSMVAARDMMIGSLNSWQRNKATILDRFCHDWDMADIGMGIKCTIA